MPALGNKILSGIKIYFHKLIFFIILECRMDKKWMKYRQLLLPLSIIYGIIIWIRNWAFDNQILKSDSYSFPIINVGNIAIGGTGKTPHIEYLIRLLNKDHKLSTLSRGYKRKTKGFIIAKPEHSYEDIGDEPKQIKSQFPEIIVSVDENRRRGIEQLRQITDAPEIILMDDAFQHRYIKAGLNILLTDYFNPYWKDQLLPVGNLRDNKAQVDRAEIVIVSKTPKSISPIKRRIIKTELSLFPYQSLFFTTIQYGELIKIGNTSDIEIDKSFSVLLLTGIAKSSHLKTHLKTKFAEVNLAKYNDHHSYSESDIKNIIQQFTEIKNSKKIIVTTLKDAVRLKDNSIFANLSNLPIYYQAIEVGFLNEDDKDKFNKKILKYVRDAKRDRRVY